MTRHRSEMSKERRTAFAAQFLYTGFLLLIGSEICQNEEILHTAESFPFGFLSDDVDDDILSSATDSMHPFFLYASSQADHSVKRPPDQGPLLFPPESPGFPPGQSRLMNSKKFYESSDVKETSGFKETQERPFGMPSLTYGFLPVKQSIQVQSETLRPNRQLSGHGKPFKNRPGGHNGNQPFTTTVGNNKQQVGIINGNKNNKNIHHSEPLTSSTSGKDSTKPQHAAKPHETAILFHRETSNQHQPLGAEQRPPSQIHIVESAESVISNPSRSPGNQKQTNIPHKDRGYFQPLRLTAFLNQEFQPEQPPFHSGESHSREKQMGTLGAVHIADKTVDQGFHSNHETFSRPSLNDPSAKQDKHKEVHDHGRTFLIFHAPKLTTTERPASAPFSPSNRDRNHVIPKPRPEHNSEATTNKEIQHSETQNQLPPIPTVVVQQPRMPPILIDIVTVHENNNNGDHKEINDHVQLPLHKESDDLSTRGQNQFTIPPPNDYIRPHQESQVDISPSRERNQFTIPPPNDYIRPHQESQSNISPSRERNQFTIPPPNDYIRPHQESQSNISPSRERNQFTIPPPNDYIRPHQESQSNISPSRERNQFTIPPPNDYIRPHQKSQANISPSRERNQFTLPPPNDYIRPHQESQSNIFPSNEQNPFAIPPPADYIIPQLDAESDISSSKELNHFTVLPPSDYIRPEVNHGSDSSSSRERNQYYAIPSSDESIEYLPPRVAQTQDEHKTLTTLADNIPSVHPRNFTLATTEAPLRITASFEKSQNSPFQETNFSDFPPSSSPQSRPRSRQRQRPRPAASRVPGTPVIPGNFGFLSSGTPFGPQNVPGRAGSDYPTFNEIPFTNFDCKEYKVPGFYADMEAGCQVFHTCDMGMKKHSFICPNGTIFHQEFFICDWWYNVRCDDSPSFFNLNARLYIDPPEKEDKKNQKKIQKKNFS